MFAGDIQRNNLDDGFDFLAWISSLPYTHKILTFGNHDGNYEIMLLKAREYKNIIILNHESIEIDKLVIFGSPYSLEYGNWWFGKTETELVELYKKIPDNTDILITHSPPYGIGDLTLENINAGSPSLLERIKQLNRLKYHIFGHIHEGQGIYGLGKVAFINTSLLDRAYSLVNEPTILGY